MATELAQSLSVKRAEVDFHRFASFGEPERAISVYGEENARRLALLRKHPEYCAALTPFLEIGANAGHTSYMLVKEFEARGFALDLSADALRYGQSLKSAWGLRTGPVLAAGDALRLPFRDGVLRAVFTYQTLSQFLRIEDVFREVHRVLAPGGVFIFAEEPIRRRLTLNLYRFPYPERMKTWEKKLYDWGLLDYVARDVIGAQQEESFGIRQNHRLGFGDWKEILGLFFEKQDHELFVRERGWANALVHRRISLERAADALGGTLAAFCRKEGSTSASTRGDMDRFESLLACPDCGAAFEKDPRAVLTCVGCGYATSPEEGVYNLLPNLERQELYPGPRPDTLDFSRPGHEQGLLEGFHELEGQFGNRYRWIGARAVARLARVREGNPRLQIRGYCHPMAFQQKERPAVRIRVNGSNAGSWKLSRPGLFVLESDLPEGSTYTIEILASPVWQAPGEDRIFTVNLSMIRLLPLENPEAA